MRTSTILLDLGTHALSLQPPLVRAPCPPRWMPDDRGSDSIAEEVGEAFPRCCPVASLETMLGRVDRQHSARQPAPEATENAFALNFIQCGRCAEVEAELYARVRRVDSLSAGPGSVGKPLEKFTGRYREALRCARTWRDVQIVHTAKCDAIRSQSHGATVANWLLFLELSTNRRGPFRTANRAVTISIWVSDITRMHSIVR